MSNEINKAMDSFLLDAGVVFKAVFAGATKQDNWDCDGWKIAITRNGTYEKPATKGIEPITTDYYTGTGHRKQIKKMMTPAIINKNSIAYHEWAKDAFKAVAPDAAGVLHSLLMDAQAVDQSFDDWASDLGYDTDSMKAFRTYGACCAMGRQLRQFFTSAERETLREMLQDY